MGSLLQEATLARRRKVNDVLLGLRTLSCHVTLMHGAGWGVHRLSTRDVARIEASVDRNFSNVEVRLAGSPPQTILRADGSINRVLFWPHVQHRGSQNLWGVRNFLVSRGGREGRERPNFHISVDAMS